MRIWNDPEMHEALIPKIIKFVINESAEVSAYAAEKFLELLEEVFIRIQSEYIDLQKQEKDTLEESEAFFNSLDEE